LLHGQLHDEGGYEMTEEKVIIEVPLRIYNEIKEKFTETPDKVFELAAKKYLEKIQN